MMKGTPTIDDAMTLWSSWEAAEEVLRKCVWAAWFYNSRAWLDCRLAFLQSKFFICERCGGAATIAHHKTYLTPENINDPESCFLS